MELTEEQRKLWKQFETDLENASIEELAEVLTAIDNGEILADWKEKPRAMMRKLIDAAHLTRLLTEGLFSDELKAFQEINRVLDGE